MKKTILGLFAAAMLVGGTATLAEAKTRVQLYFGVPYYDEQIGDDYLYYPDRGWYRDDRRQSFYQDYGRYDRRYRDNNRNYGRISCNRARNLVRNQGFRNVVRQDCTGNTYAFTAQRNNRRILLYVNARTGAVRRG